jgi:hypothetical protein
MKTIITEKLLTFILLLGGMFIGSFSNGQNCPSNKVWACRFDACGFQECKCVSVSQVQSWTATVPPCSFNFHHCCKGWRIGENESDKGIETSLQVYPNPVSSSAIISFSLEQSQNTSLRIFDMNGRLVSTLADAAFEEGDYEIVWNTSDVNAGMYFLQFQSEENFETIKLAVTK